MKRDFKYILLLLVGFISYGQEERRSVEKNNEIEFSMSSVAGRNKPTVDSMQDYYGERNNFKNYRNNEAHAEEEGKSNRHQWRRIDPYSEDE